MSETERPVTVDEVYLAVCRARGANPYDGRTREGRAWADGAWRAMEEIKSLLRGEWSS